jgi:hypothetical protein
MEETAGAKYLPNIDFIRNVITDQKKIATEEKMNEMWPKFHL